MPTSIIIGPRGFARLSAVAFWAAALTLAATAAYARFVGGSGTAVTILLLTAAVCAFLPVYVLRAARKAQPRFEPPPRKLGIVIEPEPIEYLPPAQSDDLPERRY